MYRIGDEESFKEGRALAKQEGIVGGGSTGTVLAATRRLLEDLKTKNALENTLIVIMIHDTGRTYLSKMYNDDWMIENGFATE
jgi:cystathionine beta-synthase